jgi:hypothetical protein
MMHMKIQEFIKQESKSFMTKQFFEKHSMLVKKSCFIILDSIYFLEN